MNNVIVNDTSETIENGATGNFIMLVDDSEVTTSGGSLIAKNRGSINLTNVTASLKTNSFINSYETATVGENSGYYISGYEINVNGGSYTSELSGTNSSLFQLSGMKANFNGVTINTKTAGCVYLPNRYDLTKGTPTNAESTPNATFEDCTFTIEGPKPSSRQWLSSLISVAEANVAQIKSGKYTLAGSEASSDPYGFYVYSSNGGFIIDGGEFVNENNSQPMFTFSKNTVEEFNYLNNNTPSAVVKGGDFTNAGTLTNTAKTSSDDSAAGQLKVTGGSYGSSEQVSNYVPAGSVAEKSSGSTFTIGEDPNNEWKQDETTKTTYYYVLGKTSTLITATDVTAADSVNLNYDSDNKLVFIPNVSYTWNADLASGRSLAKINIADNAVSISPEKGSVIIAGASYIGNVTTLTTTGETDIGITVDATDNKLENITGGTGNDSLKAGERNTTLNGGAGDDTLEGNSGDDLFIYTAGKDEIKNYTYGTDTVSVTSDSKLTPPVDLDKLSFNNGSDLVIKFDDNGDNRLTFRSAADVALVRGKATYSYQGNSNGMNYVAFNSETEHGISLGAGYSGRFNGANAANEDYATIDASHVTSAIRVTGNDNDNYMVAGKGGGTFEGGAGNDIIDGASATSSLRFVGGDGDDTLVGGTDYNVFVYNEGNDIIRNYNNGNLVNVNNSVNLANAEFSLSGENFVLGFDSGDSLTLENVASVTSGVSIQSGSSSKNIYVYKKDRIALGDKSITLTSGYSADSFGPDIYDTINASAVTKAISIVGNDNNNVIFGSKQGGTLFGGAGKDKLDVTERESGKNFVFQYTEGKDTVSGFVAGDKLEITADKIDEITKAKSSKSNTRLAFTFDKSNVLTFNSDGDEISRVSLNGGGFLTKDGVVKGTNFKLFASARGKIDLTEAPYVGAGIASINAADVKKQSVTLIGGSQGGQFTFAEKNKKKDQFEYNGGNVSISGYETGVDRLDLNTAALGTFSVEADGGDVSLSAGDNVVVLKNMQGQEVLLHHANSKRSSFTKMVFKQEGVILNKEKRPTMATVSASYDASGDDSTVKKIFVADGTTSNLAITAGDRNKTTLDASAAASGKISLIGGAKNDKLIGNTSTVVSDTFIYTAGKDIIQNYGSNDQISLGGSFADSLFTSKINAGSRSIKFKLGGSSKNTLTVKPAKGSTWGDALDISGIPKYTYSKNAIASGSNVTLTSEFSGSYKLKSGVNNVNGHLVEKNLTFRGTSSDETLAGGTKKTTFKGGGGSDSLKGGSGNDVFFYAKGDSGNATIADFDFNKDKLKIASGTITNISTVSGGIKFDMNNGKKNSANIASFTIGNIIEGYDDDGNAIASTKKAVIKANNTYLWFADENVTDSSGNVLAQAGELITADSKVSKSQVSDYAVIDLGYSSNLVKAGIATKAGEFDFNKDSITKKTTNNG